jgi:hypothetical protein
MNTQGKGVTTLRISILLLPDNNKLSIDINYNVFVNK